jgi:hypothetical protein
MCYHNVEVLYEDGFRELWHPIWQPRRYTLREGRDEVEDLLETQFIPGCSPMFRKDLLSEYPEWYYYDRSPDWTLYVLMAQHGKIGYIDRSMGVYRVHSGGDWSGIDRAQKAARITEFYKNIGSIIDHKYADVVKAKEAQNRRELELRSGRLYKALAFVAANAGIRRVRRIVKRILPVRVRHLIRALWRLQYSL